MMEVGQLKYFLTLCKTKNFSRAAEEMYVTQPTLSQQIKRLEQELGVVLFDRSTRNVQLTEAGKACQVYAQQALGCLEEMAAVAKVYQRRIAGSLTVGVLAVLPYLNVPGALAAFQKEYPEVTTTLQFDWSVGLLEQLNKKKLDVVISNVYFGTDARRYSQLNARVFLEDSLYVVINKKHRLAQNKQISLKDIYEETFWTNDTHSSVRIRLEALAQEMDLPPLRFREAQSMISVFKMVEANLGVSVLSHNVAKEYMRSGICCLPLFPRTKIQTAVVTRKDARPNGAAKLFEAFFLQYIQKHYK